MRVGGKALPRDTPLKEHSEEFRCKMAASGINIIESYNSECGGKALWRDCSILAC